MSELISNYNEEDCWVYDTKVCPECGIYVYSDERDCECKCELEEVEPYYDELLGEDCYYNARYEANKILDASNNFYVLVEGTTRRWNGDREVNTIIKETKLEDIINKYMEVDRLSIDVFEDKVEVENCHHDGCNSYTFRPFDFNDLTINELKQYFDKYAIQDFNDYGYEKSFSNARKYDLIEFVENYELWD